MYVKKFFPSTFAQLKLSDTLNALQNAITNNKCLIISYYLFFKTIIFFTIYIQYPYFINAFTYNKLYMYLDEILADKHLILEGIIKDY